MSEINSRPEVNWWIDQIQSGLRFRSESAMEMMWEIWRGYYRNDFGVGVLPHNFFFPLLRSMVPRVYFKNPAVSVTPSMPGAMNAAFAQIQERIDNKLLIFMNVKKHIKKMIHNTFLYGTGAGKLGYGGQFTPTPEMIGDTKAPVHPRFGSFEYKSGVMPNMPWFGSVHPKHLVLPYGCSDVDEARWYAVEVERPLQDVKKDPRFKNTQDLVPNRAVSISVGNTDFRAMKPIETVKLYEIHDKKFRTVLVLSMDHKKFLFAGPDDLLSPMGFNMFELVFNHDDLSAWGIPDSLIIEPQQLEMNEIKTQIMKHRRFTLIKLLYQQGNIEPAQLDKLLSEDPMVAVGVKELPGILPLKASTIPPELVQAALMTQSDVREQVGFGRNQSGELSDSERTTATEASIVQMASEIRVDERQDLVAEMMHKMVDSMHQVIYKFWREPQIIDIVGPGGIPLWIEYSGKMLSGGAYEISIEPESSLPMTKQTRRRMALEGYQLFKDNPLVDPVSLTRHTLREYYGFRYEDLMKNLPQGAGIQRPMSVDQYGQMLSNTQGRLPMGNQAA